MLLLRSVVRSNPLGRAASPLHDSGDRRVDRQCRVGAGAHQSPDGRRASHLHHRRRCAARADCSAATTQQHNSLCSTGRPGALDSCRLGCRVQPRGSETHDAAFTSSSPHRLGLCISDNLCCLLAAGEAFSASLGRHPRRSAPAAHAILVRSRLTCCFLNIERYCHCRQYRRRVSRQCWCR